MASGWWKKIAPMAAPSSGAGGDGGGGDGLEFLADELDDEFDPFMNDGKRAGPGGNEEEEEEEEPQEEVKLTHETGNAAAKATDDIALHFQTLQAQVVEFRERYAKAREAQVKLVEKCDQLEEQVESLKEDNEKLQSDVAMGGGALVLRVGGGGGPKMAARGGMAKALLSVTDEIDMDVAEDMGDEETFLQRLRAWWLRNKPLQAEYRRVSARFGGGTTSYFFFYRFIFLQFSLMAIISIVFTATHVSRMVARGEGYNGIMGLTGTSFLPNFMLYSTYRTSEGFEYSLMVVLGILTLIMSVMEHYVTEDRNMKEVDVSDAANDWPISREVFCAWDCSMTTSAEANDQSSSLVNKFIQILEDEEQKGKEKSRTNWDLFVLWLRRFLGFSVYCGIQFASFVAIIYLTISEEEVSKTLSGTPLAPFSSSLAPIISTVLSTIVPVVLKMITTFESWDSPSVYTSLLLVRTYLFTILNTLLLGLSYILLADPFLLADSPEIRGSLVPKQVDANGCLIDKATSSLFTLVVTGFLTKEVLINFVLPFVSHYLSLYFFNKAPTKAPFELVDSTVDTLNFVSAILLTFPFSPLSLLFGPIMIYIRIKHEIYVLMHYQAKPAKIWKVHYSGVIFTGFYLCTLFFVGLPAAVYFLTTKTFPKECDIQDNYVNLCAGPVDPVSNTCTVSKTSDFYDAYGKNKLGYPAVICNAACGAFTYQRNNFAAFKDLILYLLPLEVIWDALFTYPYLPWGLLCLMLVRQSLRTNTIKINQHIHEKGEKHLMNKLNEKDKEARKFERENKKLKLQLGLASGE